MPDPTEEAKRELERQIEEPTKKSMKLAGKGLKGITEYLVEKFRYYFTSPFKVIQGDGRTGEIIKLDIQGGLTLEETKEFLMKANNDNVKILVKEYTPDDRVFEKTLHAQDKLYENDKDFETWKKWKDRLKKVPIISTVIQRKLDSIKVKIEKENETEARYMIFTNKSNREWLNETLIEVRDNLLKTDGTKDFTKEDLEEPDFTNEIFLKAEEIKPNHEYGIGVEKYTSNYCEVKMTKKDFVALDETFTENDIKHGAKLFEDDNLVTVRFKKEDFDHYYASNPSVEFYQVKEVGVEGGMKIATAEENNPVIDIQFEDKRAFWEHREKTLRDKDYIATYQTDGTVNVKLTGDVIVKDNENVKKKKMDLEELAYEEFIKGGHDKSELDFNNDVDMPNMEKDKDIDE